jgi:endonuclease-3
MTRKTPSAAPKSSRGAAQRPRRATRSGSGPTAPASIDPAVRTIARKVVRSLKADYPDAACALVHRSALELLVATILSAQCTDQRVNIVTKDLFRRWPTAADLVSVPIGALEEAIQSTGFFHNKARNIKACCQQLMEKYDGQVPRDMDQMVELAGVGRKTANVVLGTAYGLATGVVVDTHVARVSRRLGLTKHTDPVKIERDLMELMPKDEWIDFSHRMIHHGRRICVARKPLCNRCSMDSFCPKIGVVTDKETH